VKEGDGGFGRITEYFKIRNKHKSFFMLECRISCPYHEGKDCSEFNQEKMYVDIDFAFSHKVYFS
jgi:hypothetical protein